MRLFCFHSWNKVDKDGYQYCNKCGRGKYIGVPKCNHIWQTTNTIEKSNSWNRITGYTYIQKCIKCGELKKFIVSVNDI